MPLHPDFGGRDGGDPPGLTVLVVTKHPDRYADLPAIVDFAEDARSAAAMAHDGRYQLILVDVNLGNGTKENGFSVVRSLRGDYLIAVDIYLVTDEPSPSDRRHATVNNATGIVSRNRDDLLAVLGGVDPTAGRKIQPPPEPAWLMQVAGVLRDYIGSEAEPQIRRIYETLRRPRPGMQVETRLVVEEAVYLLDDDDDKRSFTRRVLEPKQIVPKKRSFLRLPLGVQFLSLVLVLLTTAGVSIWVAKTTLMEATGLQRARTIANMAEAVNAWASHVKGVWVRSDPDDPSIRVGEFLEHRVIARTNPDGTLMQTGYGALRNPTISDKGLSSEELAQIQSGGAYHFKNPALIVRELSDVVNAAGTNERLRITSDRFFNADNMPNSFEHAAIERLREKGFQGNEVYEVRDGRMLYARKLVAEQACMRCHDTPEKSPEVIRKKFQGSRGWGYEVGGVAGVLSVQVDLREQDSETFLRSVSWPFWVSAAGVLLALTLLVLWVRLIVIGASRTIEDYSRSVINAEPGNAVARQALDDDEVTSRNELHKLSSAVRALAAGLRLVQGDRKG